MVMGTFQGESGDLHAGASAEPKLEEISLLMDGELDAARVESICGNLRQLSCVTTWVCYHVIGDALRGPCATRAGFAERFAERLAAEPTVLAPQPRKTGATAIALAAAAGVAAVSVVGWVALSTMPMPVPQTAITAARQAALVRASDARRAVDNEYLLAHQEYSPTTAIQGVRPYLRAVSSSEPDARP
jgi:sigma-E factor negative regulatory protein RseA